MKSRKVNDERRSFLKVSALAGGGFILGFPWLLGCEGDVVAEETTLAHPTNWYDLTAYLKIGDTGLVTIMSPNPEIGQNVKTAMPMIVAEELEVDWKNVNVEQAPFDETKFERQVAGGSQSIRKSWTALRTAGATAKQILVEAAAKQWGVPVGECSVAKGIVSHPSHEALHYGQLAASLVDVEIPKNIKLKDPKDFSIIGKGKMNVDMEGIVTGKALFGIDQAMDALVAMVKRPDGFGMKLKSFDAEATKAVSGVEDVFSFEDKIAVIAKNTWAAMKGLKMLKAEYYPEVELADSTSINKQLLAALNTKSNEPKRNDGDVDAMFSQAEQIVERSYEAPFLPHNPLEPMNFYAHITDEKVELSGPIQTPAWTRNRVAELLERPKEQITIDMTRMGGGFGRRLYGNYVLELAQIADKIRKPVKIMYSREDEMMTGPFRPASAYTFKAALNKIKITAYHLTGAGVNMSNACRENNFPAGTLSHYRVDSHNIESNIPTGAWRAPITNFLAYAEQAFFDEIAEILEKDPIDVRLDLLYAAKDNPVGELDYEIDKMIGVIQLARLKSGWDNAMGKHLGFSVYYSHNTYVAEVAEVVMSEGYPRVTRVCCAVDCGLVVNPLGAINQIEGGIIDGIGHAMYGDLAFEKGRAMQQNFHQYRMIRIDEVPEIDVHFVESLNDPTGLGEPTLPPAGGAVANAIFKATGKRLYKQPFEKELGILG